MSYVSLKTSQMIMQDRSFDWKDNLMPSLRPCWSFQQSNFKAFHQLSGQDALLVDLVPQMSGPPPRLGEECGDQ